jgi:hypothetical protein
MPDKELVGKHSQATAADIQRKVVDTSVASGH